jgi:cysteine-rich repeat protein
MQTLLDADRRFRMSLLPRLLPLALVLLALAGSINGCLQADEDEETVETISVSGRVTRDGRPVVGTVVLLKEILLDPGQVEPPQDQTATTVGGGIFNADIPVDLKWEVGVLFPNGLCPTEYLDSSEPPTREVNLPCVSGDGKVRVTYTPVENDCGLPTRDEFSAEADAATRVEEDSLLLAWTFTDGPEPITVEGVYDAESGTFIGQTPEIAFEGGTGQEYWDIEIDFEATVTTPLPEEPSFDGEVDVQYAFDNPDAPGETLDCIERLEVRVEYTETTAPTCGDGAPDPDEECDDGNRENGDGCSSTCRIES